MKKNVDERRNEILDVTCRVVIARGFGNTRIADVAKALGVSTGLIHYHFDSKDQLLSAAFEHAAHKDLRTLNEQLATAGTPIEKLKRVLELYEPEVAESSWMLWIDAWGEAMRNEALQRTSRDLDVAWKDHLESVFREGVRSGDFTCADPRAAAWRLGALVDGLSVQAIVHSGVVSHDDLRRWVRHAAAAELGLPARALDPARARRPAAGRAARPRASAR